MCTYKILPAGNARRVEEKPSTDPHFNKRLLPGQKPLMCSDSRVLAKEIMTTKAGYIFLPEDTATMVVHSGRKLSFKAFGKAGTGVDN